MTPALAQYLSDKADLDALKAFEALTAKIYQPRGRRMRRKPKQKKPKQKENE